MPSKQHRKNELGSEGAIIIIEALRMNTTLTRLDLRCNNLDAATKAAMNAARGDVLVDLFL